MNKIQGRLCQIVNKKSMLELLFEVNSKSIVNGIITNDSFSFRTCLPIPFEQRFYQNDEEKKHGFELNGIYEITLKRV